MWVIENFQFSVQKYFRNGHFPRGTKYFWSVLSVFDKVSTYPVQVVCLPSGLVRPKMCNCLLIVDSIIKRRLMSNWRIPHVLKTVTGCVFCVWWNLNQFSRNNTKARSYLSILDTSQMATPVIPLQWHLRLLFVSVRWRCVIYIWRNYYFCV